MCTGPDGLHGKMSRKQIPNKTETITDLMCISNQSRQMLVHCGVLKRHNNVKSPTEKLWVAVSRQRHENMAFSQRIVTEIKVEMKKKQQQRDF